MNTNGEYEIQDGETRRAIQALEARQDRIEETYSKSLGQIARELGAIRGDVTEIKEILARLEGWRDASITQERGHGRPTLDSQAILAMSLEQAQQALLDEKRSRKESIRARRQDKRQLLAIAGKVVIGLIALAAAAYGGHHITKEKHDPTHQK